MANHTYKLRLTKSFFCSYELSGLQEHFEDDFDKDTTDIDQEVVFDE